MKSILRIVFSGMPVLFIVIIGCGKNTTGNIEIPQGNSSISVKVQDESGKSLPGFKISTQPVTKNIMTDSTGCAILEKIPNGKYDVLAQKKDFSNFSKVITVEEGEIQEVSFTYLPTVNIMVRDDAGRPCQGATISTYPPTFTLSTDKTGSAVFCNMPQRALDFTVRRPDYPNITQTVPALTPSLELIVQSAFPVTSILSPVHDSILPSTDNVKFSGSGFDLEDGELPDSSLVWYSQRDGILGTGKTLTASHLSPGNHIITLKGTDSDNKAGETSIPVRVIDFQLNSFFPIPPGESWSYRYMEPGFYMTNTNNQVEYWSLQNISVRIGDDLERITEVYWDVLVNDTTLTHYVLTLTDYMEVDGDDLYVTRTVEQSKEWKGILPPYLTMLVTTTYTPRYLFLKNSSNVTAERNYSSTVQSETLWNYVYYSEISETYREVGTLTTSIQVGDEKSIQTDKGIFPAVNLTITQKNAVKKWSLTKGIGLVRIEDNTFDPSEVAVLNDASIYRFYLPPSQKNILTLSALPKPPIHLDFKIDRGNFQNMKAFQKLLSGMFPR
jgi:hypothetical protein